MKRAIYPGSFDPITYGHIDIINRALTIFDELIIGIAQSFEKSPIFSANERALMINESFAHDARIRVLTFDGLLVDFARHHESSVVIRGLRAASDFEYEFQLAAMNRHLGRNFETVFLMTGSETYFLSSRLVKEVASLGGDIDKMVPAHVAVELKQKYAKTKG